MVLKITRWITVFAFLPLLCWGQDVLQPATAANSSLLNKHSLTIQIGFSGQATNSTSLSETGIAATTSANGPTVFLSYSYWFKANWAFFVKSGALQVEAKNQTEGYEVFSETGVVIPLLLGAKFQPETISAGKAIRPFLSVSLGPYLGFGTQSSAGLSVSNKTSAETALGARVGIGIDAFFGTHFLLGFDAGYHLVSDFSTPIANQENYSGGEVLLTLGFIWGESPKK